MVRSSCVTSLAPFWFLSHQCPWHGEPTLPTVSAVAVEVPALWLDLGWDIHPGVSIIAGTKWCGCRASWAGRVGTCVVPQCGCWSPAPSVDMAEWSKTSQIYVFWVFFVSVEPECCSDIFPGSQVLIPCWIWGKRNPGEEAFVWWGRKGGDPCEKRKRRCTIRGWMLLSSCAVVRMTVFYSTQGIFIEEHKSYTHALFWALHTSSKCISN